MSEVIDESFDLSDSKKQALKIKINSVTFEDCSKFYGHNQKLNALLVFGRGVKVSVCDKSYTLQLINDAVTSGARVAACCEVLLLCQRRYERWVKNLEDRRRGPNTEPKNKLSDEVK